VSFLKRGKAAQKLIAKADAAAEIRQSQRDVRRFFVPMEGESMVTFLDGELDSDGLLSAVAFNEHKVKMNGTWRNYFPCTAAHEPCPICEQADHYPSLVSLFTVIDHTKWKDKNGKVHRHERKLFVAKRDTLKRLQKQATKRGGLAGWRVTIGRTGDRSPETGTDFEWIEQHDLDELARTLKLPAETVTPFDYDEVIHYYTADELRDLGFGGNVVGRQDTQSMRKGPRNQRDTDDDDDDVFGDAKKAAPKAKTKAKPIVDDEDADDDDVFDAKPAKMAKVAKAAPPEEEDDDVPAKPAVKAAKKPTKPLVEDEDDDDVVAEDDSDDDGM
jgi:hypothetical protein